MTEFFISSFVLGLKLLCGLSMIALLLGVLIGIPAWASYQLISFFVRKREREERKRWLDNVTG